MEAGFLSRHVQHRPVDVPSPHNVAMRLGVEVGERPSHLSFLDFERLDERDEVVHAHDDRVLDQFEILCDSHSKGLVVPTLHGAEEVSDDFLCCRLIHSRVPVCGGLGRTAAEDKRQHEYDGEDSHLGLLGGWSRQANACGTLGRPSRKCRCGSMNADVKQRATVLLR